MLQRPQPNASAGITTLPRDGDAMLDAVSEDPRVSSVLERLGNLESRVGQQLDHLLHVQEQQVKPAVKYSLNTVQVLEGDAQPYDVKYISRGQQGCIL